MDFILSYPDCKSEAIVKPRNPKVPGSQDNVSGPMLTNGHLYHLPNDIV